MWFDQFRVLLKCWRSHLEADVWMLVFHTTNMPNISKHGGAPRVMFKLVFFSPMNTVDIYRYNPHSSTQTWSCRTYVHQLNAQKNWGTTLCLYPVSPAGQFWIAVLAFVSNRHWFIPPVLRIARKPMGKIVEKSPCHSSWNSMVFWEPQTNLKYPRLASCGNVTCDFLAWHVTNVFLAMKLRRVSWDLRATKHGLFFGNSHNEFDGFPANSTSIYDVPQFFLYFPMMKTHGFQGISQQCSSRFMTQGERISSDKVSHEEKITTENTTKKSHEKSPKNISQRNPGRSNSQSWRGRLWARASAAACVDTTLWAGRPAGSLIWFQWLESTRHGKFFANPKAMNTLYTIHSYKYMYRIV